MVWKQLKNKIEPTTGNLLISKNFLIDNQMSAFVDSNIIAGNPSLGPATQQYHLIRSGPHYQVYLNGSLRISEVNGLDATNYLCQASNGVGPGLSKMVTLKVNGKLFKYLHTNTHYDLHPNYADFSNLQMMTNLISFSHSFSPA